MSTENIEKLDKNFKIETTVNEENLHWHDITEEPFDIYGLYDPKNGKPLRRMPKDAAESVSSPVAALCLNTAGGRIRFRTDSPYIAIRVYFESLNNFSHMPRSGTGGFDLYRYEDGRYHFIKNAMPVSTDHNGYERVFFNERSNFFQSHSEMHDYLIHMPLYNAVSKIYIGLREGSTLEHGSKYRDVPPILYYGSSITQGGCASRPANAYTNMLSLAFDVDHINLGFSGNARGELAMADYIGGLNISVFVLDYDHNAPNVAHLENTHFAFYERFRQHQPNTPIVMVSRPDRDSDPKVWLRRDIIRNTYEKALALGDKNVCFVDGLAFFDDEVRSACLVDGCHPNDLGFHFMAKGIGAAIRQYL